MAREKVLIVDDEVDVLDLCQRILASQGYRVEIAHDGYEAIEKAGRETFDLLLTDIKMPGLTGLEIAQRLKEIDPNVICVTMTGFSTMDTAINALKLGIDEFILKPFTPRELNAAIAKALDKERLRKENVRLNSLIPLFELNKTLMGTVNENNLLARVLEIAKAETRASFAAIYLITNCEITKAIYDGHNSVGPEQQDAARALAQWTIDEEIDGTTSPEKADPAHQDQLKTLGVTAAIASPLKSQKSRLGTLVLGTRDSEFAPSDSEFLSVLCGQASIALENARLFTEIQDAYEQLQILDHMKSEFINIAAHELRTPLAILMGYATVLEEEAPQFRNSFISNITRNALRLRALIDDMLNLQYLESGIPSLAQDDLNLAEAVQEITRDVNLLVEEKRLNITIDIPTDFPTLVVDRQKFDLILMNLVQNAVKFTPVNGSITLRAALDGDKSVIHVHNTGSVVPEEKLNQIFERFYQIESSLTREHGGAGLGLAIVRGMVDVCGGKIWVESSEEAGTTFSFTLPLDNSHLEPRKLKL